MMVWELASHTFDPLLDAQHHLSLHDEVGRLECEQPDGTERESAEFLTGRAPAPDDQFGGGVVHRVEDECAPLLKHENAVRLGEADTPTES
jgi:hypothetical protein